MKYFVELQYMNIFHLFQIWLIIINNYKDKKTKLPPLFYMIQKSLLMKQKTIRCDSKILH